MSDRPPKLPFNATWVMEASRRCASGEKLVWSSDLEGQLGVGSAFSKALIIPGEHLITLTATDSEGLSGNASVRITVKSNAIPVVTINSPRDGAYYRTGTKVIFEGVAVDEEDPSFPNGAFVWRSNRSGVLGTGPRLEKSDLATASHTVTLSVADQQGQTGQATVVVHIVDNLPPLCTITKPTAATPIAAGAPVGFEGTCQDLESSDTLFTGAALVWKRRASPSDVVLGSGNPAQLSLPEGTQTVLLCAADPVTVPA